MRQHLQARAAPRPRSAGRRRDRRAHRADGTLARVQIAGARRCFARRSAEEAEEVAAQDGVINRLNRDIFRRALEAGTDFDTREWATCMMLVARCLERVGDNAVDICEQAAFVATGLFREFSDASRTAPHPVGRREG